MAKICLVILAYAYIATGSVLTGKLQNECDEILIPPREDFEDRETPSPIEVNACHEQKRRSQKTCTFDTDSCPNRCRFGYVKNEDGCPISCVCAVNGIFEGDIKFDEKDLPILLETYAESSNDKEKAAASNIRKWDNNRVGGRVQVPYIIDSAMSSKARQAIQAGILKYKTDTCIDFVPRTSQTDYIHFKSSGGCWSYVGRKGGPQPMSIGNGCEWSGIVQHEILHALGFWHEQSRPDRDSYVTINFANIVKNMEHNFQKRTSGINSFGSKYDKKSIMHYGGYAFSKNWQPTIVDKATNQAIKSQRDGLTESDIYQVKKMYQCGTGGTEGGSASWGVWGTWSRCSKTCGPGEQSRTRICMKNGQVTSANECTGSPSETRKCQVKECSASKWSTWGAWSSCTKTCGGGYQWRSRMCIAGGYQPAKCEGSMWETRRCNDEKCPEGTIIFGSKLVSTEKSHCVGGEMMIGDFNGDNRQDLLCIYPRGWTTTLLGDGSGKYETASWKGWSKICGPSGGGYVGDFNGDGSDDLLCFKKWNKKMEISFSKNGKFKMNASWSREGLDFCTRHTEQLLVGDINKDGKTDLICKGDGTVSALLNEYKE